MDIALPRLLTRPVVAPHADPLHELLRKAHRHELAGLAKALHVDLGSTGRDALADRLARTLRRLGGHGLANLFTRWGEGPGYDEVLRGLARRTGLADPDTPGGVQALEQALAEGWLRREWTTLSEAERERAWAELGMDPPPPTDSHALIAAVRGKGPYGYALSAVTSGLTVRLLTLPLLPLGPIAALPFIWWILRPRDDLLLPAVFQVARLRSVVRHRVTIGVVGSPSCGKDSAIRALFGLDAGNISPVAGSTTEVEITRLEGATALYLVNTPGMGDVVESVTKEAQQVLDHIDVYLYVVNAQGGVQARELADYRRCLESGRPTLAIVNKIDTLKPADQERYLADARKKLLAPEDGFVGTAFDPLPQLSPEPIGLTTVQRWIEDKLVGLGKEPAELPW